MEYRYIVTEEPCAEDGTLADLDGAKYVTWRIEDGIAVRFAIHDTRYHDYTKALHPDSALLEAVENYDDPGVWDALGEVLTLEQLKEIVNEYKQYA